LTVAGILERYLRPFLAEYHHQVTPHQTRILAKLIDCQTPRAGTHAWKCHGCGHCCVSNNWCGDRHCLHCYVKHRMDWLDQVKTSTLPCTYLHLVFTLPHEFNDLVGANQALLYNLLFTCAIQTLLRHMRRQWKIIPSITGSLHTWGSALLVHYHIHVVVSCGGLTGKGVGYRLPERPSGCCAQSVPDPFSNRWLDIDPHDPQWSRQALAEPYRRLMLTRLTSLFCKGKLILPPSIDWIDSLPQFEQWVAPMAAKDWMVNVQPPPAGSDGPRAALGYLGRYVAGTCIGDTRILQDDGTHVTIRVKNYREKGREETLKLSGVEFVRRFTLHIVPRGFRRIRHAGLLTQRKRAQYLARCRELLKDRLPNRPKPGPEPEQNAKNPVNPVNALTLEMGRREPDKEGKDTTEHDKNVTDDQPQPTPPHRCPRCLGKEFEFIECYRPVRDWQRSPRRFDLRPP
jgi:hypothetical protein